MISPANTPFYRRITIDEERLMLAFETLDLENTGFLTKDTIRKALGEHMTEEELNEMVLCPSFPSRPHTSIL